jgi:hypothetical protein
MLHQTLSQRLKKKFFLSYIFKYSFLLSFFVFFYQIARSENFPSVSLINDTATHQITIKLIETAGTNLVEYIGWSRGEDFDDGKLKTPQLFTRDPKDNYFRLDSFAVKEGSTEKKIDYLVLFDAKKNLLGHISYEYYPEKEGKIFKAAYFNSAQ